MNPILKLALDYALRHVLREALQEQFGDNVPVTIAVAAASRVFQLVEEGQAGDMTTLKTLVLMALDQAIKEGQA